MRGGGPKTKVAWWQSRTMARNKGKVAITGLGSVPDPPLPVDFLALK